MSRIPVSGVTPPSPLGVDRIPFAQTKLGLAAAAVISATPVRLARISVIVAGTTTGAAYDSASTGADAAGNEVFVIPNTVGVYDIDWPCLTGLVVVPGTGQTVAVTWY